MLNRERQNDAPAEEKDELLGAFFCYLVEIIFRQKHLPKRLFSGEMIMYNTKIHQLSHLK